MGRQKSNTIIDRKCIECQSDVYPTDRVLTCSACKHPFHNDCVGVDRKSFDAVKKQPNWVCSDKCKKSTEDKRKSNADSLPNNPTNRDILLAIKEMQSSQSFMSDKYDELLTKVDSLLDQFDVLEGRINSLEKENAKIKSQLNRQNVVKGNVTQKELNCNVVISGIRNVNDSMEAVEKVSNVMGEGRNVGGNVVKAERLFQQANTNVANGNQQQKVIDKIPIVVKFVSENAKDVFMKAAKKNKYVYTALECGFATENEADEIKNSKIIIKDHISATNMRLLKEAKQLKTSGKVQFVWFQNSSVLVRKDCHAKIIKINSSDDFEKFNVE